MLFVYESCKYPETALSSSFPPPTQSPQESRHEDLSFVCNHLVHKNLFRFTAVELKRGTTERRCGLRGPPPRGRTGPIARWKRGSPCKAGCWEFAPGSESTNAVEEEGEEMEILKFTWSSSLGAKWWGYLKCPGNPKRIRNIPHAVRLGYATPISEGLRTISFETGKMLPLRSQGRRS